MYLTTLRRNTMIGPLAVVVAGLLAASPVFAQPATGAGDSHASPVDDPGMSTPAPPAMEESAPVEELWFFVKDGAKAGPVNTAGLRQLVVNGAVETNSKVWKKGMSGWLPMSTLPEFADLTPPPPPTDTAAKPGAALSFEPEPERIRNKGFLVSGGIVFSITWLAAIVSAVFASESEETDYDSYNYTNEVPEHYKTYSYIAWLPVVGPVAGYAGSGGSDNRVIMLTTLWSLAQATGLGLFIAGAVGKKNPKYKGEEAGIEFAPMLGEVNGIGLTGRF